MENQTKDRSRRYLNPYLGGVLLGIVLIAANFVAGRGLGASGAIKSVVIAATDVVAPAHVEKNAMQSRLCAAMRATACRECLCIFQVPSDCF